MKGISGSKLNITTLNVFLGVDLDGKNTRAPTRAKFKHADGCNV